MSFRPMIFLLQRDRDVAGAFGRGRRGESTKIRARRIAASSASRVFGVNAPTRSTCAPFFSQAPRTSGCVGQASRRTRCRPRRTASSRSSAITGSMPAADSANAVETARERVRFQSVTRLIGRTARCARTRCGLERAGADHHQMRRVLAREIARRERGGRRRPPQRQRGAVDHAPAARRCRPTSARSCRAPTACRALALSGNTLTSLRPMKPLARRGPGRHQQHLGLAAGRLRDRSARFSRAPRCRRGTPRPARRSAPRRSARGRCRRR